MAEETPPKPRLMLLPTGGTVGPLLEQIRAFAVETKKVFLSEHAEKRMWERDISMIEVLEVLRIGFIAGAPWLEPETNEQACKVVFKKKGARAVGVVVIVMTADGLLIKTVEWED